MEAARRLLGVALLCAASVNCSFKQVPDNNGGKDDGGIDAPDTMLPDAGPCPATSAMCASSTVLRECLTVGQMPVDTTCTWGCLDATGAHCGKLQPTGTWLTATDLDRTPAVQNTTAMSPGGMAGVIDTETGEITGVRVAGTGVVSGIEFQVRTFNAGAAGTRSVGVFRFGKLTLSGDWNVRGANALALVSLGDVIIEGQLDLTGGCASTGAGPGGFAGGASQTTGAGPGGGQAGSTGGGGANGGAGGGHGDTGGNGGRNNGNRPLGGTVSNTPELTLLFGGSGGGGGGNGGNGGGGGGAIHIATNGKVTIRTDGATQPSGINAGGCGGARGGSDAGGGGGAGGAILIEATAVELNAAGLAVNGGSGGGGDNATGPGNGAAGQLSLTAATGGQAGSNGGAGGNGGTTVSRSGMQGGDNTSGGGGGGGVGRIRINTRAAGAVTLQNNAFVSPTLMEPTSTQSTVMVQ